jgi:hypothetical protein
MMVQTMQIMMKVLQRRERERALWVMQHKLGRRTTLRRFIILNIVI